ncbi:MAG: VWA domain-containing protein [Acidobacteriia bacterium]|nr:VWA domain-containing protein [Terriglobia bacterium]
MATKIRSLGVLVLTLLLAGALAGQQKPEDIPDAPSATRPIPPPEPPSPRPGAEEEPQPETPPAKAPGEGVTTGSKELPRSTPDATDQKPTPPPMPPITTVPAGSVPRDAESGQDVGFTIRATTNLVLVPVMVKDSEGRLVGGLQPKDFSVLENGQKQTLKFFTSDPFALSAAVVIDTGMPDVGLKKVQETLSALQGAFSQFDEVGIYTYSSTVGRVADFTAVGKQLTVALNEVKQYSGANNGPPVTSGPLGPQGPIINGRPIDSTTTPISTPPRVARVMNDAILMAARDLSKRDRARRKIIFVISDGREQGSTASYADTLKVLLTQNITLYAVGVEGAAIPVYDKLQRIHLPKTGKLLGYSDILPKYVSATGGGTVYNELAQADIERAYARAIGDARNQYTMGYTSKSGIGGYRQIEVRVRGRGGDLKVYAKDGYYPLPSPR